MTSFAAPSLTIRTPVIEAVIETPTFDVTVFKLHFGRFTGNAYTKDERVLRFEVIAAQHEDRGSWPRCAAHAWDADPRTGPTSTATTNAT